MRYCGHFLIKAEGGGKNYKRDILYRYPSDPLPSFSCSERVTGRPIYIFDDLYTYWTSDIYIGRPIYILDVRYRFLKHGGILS